MCAPYWSRRHLTTLYGCVWLEHDPPGAGPGAGVGATGAGVRKVCVSDHGPITGDANARACQYNCTPPGRSEGDGSEVWPGASLICQTATWLENAALVESSMAYVTLSGAP